MQHNPGTRSIEDEVMGALAKAGAVAPVNAGKYDKVGPWALTLYAKALRKFNAPTRSGRCAEAQSRRMRQQGQLCPLVGAACCGEPCGGWRWRGASAEPAFAAVLCHTSRARRRAGVGQVHWSRAARTDKGVSAVGNVVSLKMLIGAPDLLQRINAALPPQARTPRCQPRRSPGAGAT